jgi:hypothetical protein
MTNVENGHKEKLKMKFERNQSHLDFKEENDYRYNIEFLFASRLIQDAMDSRKFDYKKSQAHIRYYEIFLRREFSWILQVTILVNLCLAFIEAPTDLVFVPYWVPCLIEIICLHIYLFRIFHLFTFLTPQAFWKDKKNWILLLTILVSIFSKKI